MVSLDQNYTELSVVCSVAYGKWRARWINQQVKMLLYLFIFIYLLIFFIFSFTPNAMGFNSGEVGSLPVVHSCLIHRMQIWRTTRSAPGTSGMKARLVRLWCFVLTMLFQRSLASLSIWSLCFVLSTRFCVSECHRNRVESSTAEKASALFFSFLVRLWGETKETVKVKVGIDLRKCVSDRI